jgi:hypothetical protein
MRRKKFDISNTRLLNIHQIKIVNSDKFEGCKTVFIKGIFDCSIMINCFLFSDGELLSQSSFGVKTGCMDRLEILRGVRPVEEK